MARYDYKCTSCGNVFEVEHPMSETPEVVCLAAVPRHPRRSRPAALSSKAAVSTTPTSEAVVPAPTPPAAAAPTARITTRNQAAPRPTPIAGLFLCAKGGSMSCGEIRTVWQLEAAIQSLFHRNLVVTCGPVWRRSGRRRSRRLRERFGRGLDRSGVRKRASWPDRTRGVAESVLRKAAPR